MMLRHFTFTQLHMRYLLFFILLFLIIRLVSHAYFNRPSKRGPRNAAGRARESRQRTPNAGPNARKRGFQEIEDADYEIIEEEPEKQPDSSKS